MALAGVTAVGEFHYLHHAPDGGPYADPNAMGQALAQAAADAGIRLTLLDTCYLAGGVDGAGHRRSTGVQRRFSDGTRAGLGGAGRARCATGRGCGSAWPCTRSGPCPRADAARRSAEAAARAARCTSTCPSSPPRTPPAAPRTGSPRPGCSPRTGLLGPATTAVHATHLTAADIALLGGSGTAACLCPTTEADLADGIGPARALRDAGCPLALGGDQHAVIDPFAEARGLEMHERLASGERGRFTPADLLDALTAHGALGWPDAGRLAVGARADLVAVRLDTPRTAGADPAQVVLAASAADVDTVVVDGDVVVAAAGTCSATSARCCRRPSRRCGRTRERHRA